MKIDPTKDYRPAIESLTADTDIFGHEIRIGSRIRSFDFAFILVDGRITGMETENCDTIAYVEGVVEAINDYSQGNTYPAYRVLVDKHVMIGNVVVMTTLEEPEEEPDHDWTLVGQRVYPPVNGTLSLLGGRTFGVVAVTDCMPAIGPAVDPWNRDG